MNKCTRGPAIIADLPPSSLMRYTEERINVLCDPTQSESPLSALVTLVVSSVHKLLSLSNGKIIGICQCKNKIFSEDDTTQSWWFLWIYLSSIMPLHFVYNQLIYIYIYIYINLRIRKETNIVSNCLMNVPG